MKPIPIEHIALSLLDHVGPVRIKKLVSHLGDPEAVFKENISTIRKVPGFKNTPKEKWKVKEALLAAEEELKFIQRKNLQVHSFWEETYPTRLKHCMDGPVVLYSFGKMDLNPQSVVSIVGTRRSSPYGMKFTDDLIKAFADLNILVVSGLAYGIDIAAHKACVKYNVPTIAVLAHGLDRIYPSQHKSVVAKMVKNGGILSEFPSGTNPDRENFPKRNRIVAGMSDATIVIESDIKGGSMITADIANSYNRDVFALPGQIDHTYSKGCNYLIKKNKAALIDSPEEFIKAMGWRERKEDLKIGIQTSFFPDLDTEEVELVAILQEKRKTTLDVLALHSKLSVSKVSTLLLTLEFKGVVKALPGKQFQLMTK